MKLRPCSCGHIPSIIRTNDKPDTPGSQLINIVRVECTCGKFTASIMFTKPELRPWAEQAAADGWNLADNE